MPRPRKWTTDGERRQAQNTKRKYERATKPVKSGHRFTGIDGEGTGEWNNHTYVLLGIGNATTVESTDGEPLTLPKIFQGLWEQYTADPNSVYAGFFLTYDFSQWFRGLTEERAMMLFHPEKRKRRPKEIDKETGEVLEENPLGPFPVRWGEWEFDLLGMKRLKIRRAGSKSWMFINDAGSFFQASFLSVIDPKEWAEPVVTEEEYRIIKEGKENRDAAVLDDDMRRYNALENEVLSRVLVRLDAGLQRVGIKLGKDQWFGPGQAAQAWLTKVQCPTGKMVRDSIAVNRAHGDILHKGRMSYYGGWFEIFAHGHMPGITWEYDINSAYPFTASRLPCLLHGRWRSDNSPIRNDARASDYRIVHAAVLGSDPVCGTMLHRRRDHSIMRPWKTAGWYWESELAAGMRAGIIDRVEVMEGDRYQPCDCPNPLRELAGLYSERLRVGKNTPEGKAYKIIYNSVYGKFAQSVGNPKFGNSLYASLITSGTRTMILDAIAEHPEGTNALVMVATDGVYFRTRHDRLDIGIQMGQWEEKEKGQLTLFKPGVYWDDSVREQIRNGENPRFKSRGISARALAQEIANIDRDFSRWNERGGLQEWPSVRIDSSFSMITPLQALQRGKWELAGTIGHEANELCTGCSGAHIVQDSDPVQKRRGPVYKPGDIWRSHPWPDAGTETESTPYDKAFGQPDPDEYGVTDDGTVIDGWKING